MAVLANMVSKNGLKANHNYVQSNDSFYQVGKYGVKERFESKSQHGSSSTSNILSWQIWCQRTVWKQITTEHLTLLPKQWLANMVSKNGLKANHNDYLAQRNNRLVGKYGVKERFESKSQLLQQEGKYRSCWQIWCQRTVWKQITTRSVLWIPPWKLANMVSKNGLKANHNWIPEVICRKSVGKYGVKERFESKSQQDMIFNPIQDSWQIWCQRTVWKQITTTLAVYTWLYMLANMVSKNGLKANHNNANPRHISSRVGKYGVKERFESKSQHVWGLPALRPRWQIWCQRTVWKQITTSPFLHRHS